MKIRINNFTPEGNRLYKNLLIEDTQGVYTLIDKSQKKYKDLRSGMWNVGLGYNNKLTQKFAYESQRLMIHGQFYLDNFSYETKLFLEVGQLLQKIIGDYYTNVQFTNSGSEGVELALKIAESYNFKENFQIAAFEESYHGSFLGGFSVSGMDAIHARSSNLTYTDTLFYQYPRNEDEEQKILKIISENAKELSAFIIEPILSSSGVVYSSIGFMNKLIAILKRNNVLVIFDEVAIGFYRTGRLFFKDFLNENPDVIILSKQINNGLLPFGAVVFSEEVLKQLIKHPIEHYSTQNGNLLGALSAKLTLEYYIENANFINQNVKNLIVMTKNALEHYKINYRNFGLMFAIILDDEARAFELTLRLQQFGFLVYPFENKTDAGITIYPMLIAPEKEFEKDIERVAKLIDRYG